MSLVAMIFPQFKMLQKFQKNLNKNQYDGSFRNPEGGPRGPLGAQAARWHDPTPGRAIRAPGSTRWPLAPPFGLYYLFAPETLEENPASRNTSLFRPRHASKIGSTRRTLPGTLPEGGL